MVLLQVLICLLTLPVLSLFPAYAQEAPTNQAQIQQELQQLYSQWRQEQPQIESIAPHLQKYLLEKQMKPYVSSETDLDVASDSLYQPFYQLPNGAWIMGFVQEAPNTITALVDLKPTAGGNDQSSEFLVKKFVLDARSGQVIRIQVLGQ